MGNQCVLPEQLGGMPTPRTGEKLHGTGAQVLDGRLRIIAPETGEDVTRFHVNGAKYTLEIAKIGGARRSFMRRRAILCSMYGEKECEQCICSEAWNILSKPAFGPPLSLSVPASAVTNTGTLTWSG